MSFEPIRDGHAIAEVVFGLLFDRPLSPIELGKFANSHDKFKAILPGRSQIANLPIAFSGPALTVQSSGIAFERYNSAGQLEQRLRLEGNAAFLNTMGYSRWAAISKEAFDLLDSAIALAKESAISVTGITLQYVDVFEWRNDVAKYDLKELLVSNGQFYPASIFGNGHLWHLHQGWFRHQKLAEPGRILERISTDGVMNEKSEPIVRLDCYLGYEFSGSMAFNSFQSKTENKPSLQELFHFLHDENKSIMASCLTDQIKKKIGLV